jgi:hypothetical protein
MERRKSSVTKPSLLPKDYLQMVSEVFTSHFEAGLKILKKTFPNPKFSAHGEIFSDEVVVAISLISPEHLAATTIYASSDFDPKASSPTVQDLLEACVDGIGTIFGPLLSPEKPEQIEQLGEESLSALENVPFDWTEMESNQRRIFLKIDKSNPEMDAMTDEWLKKNDPDYVESEKSEQKEIENLFFTGPKSGPGSKSGSGITH